MKREIVLSSYSVKNVGNNTPQDFMTRFNRPLVLDKNYEYAIGLNRIINMSFTWYNVNPGYSNQTIAYSSDNGVNYTDIVFPPGVWNYTEFDEYIKELSKKDDEYPISLIFNETTFRVTITLANNYKLDLTKSNFNELIGFDKVILSSGTNNGVRVPNLSQDTNILNLHSDLVTDSLVDGEDTDIIYSFSTSVLTPSYSFTLEPRRVTYNPVNKTTIQAIRIYITDGKRRIVNLNGADTAFSLIIKKIE